MKLEVFLLIVTFVSSPTFLFISCIRLLYESSVFLTKTRKNTFLKSWFFTCETIFQKENLS